MKEICSLFEWRKRIRGTDYSAHRENFDSMKRIATEEAFCTPEVAAAIRDVTRNASKTSLDLRLLRAVYDNPAPGSMGAKLLRGLLDLEDERLRIMDENNVNMHILSLTSPGVQMFDAAIACEFASRS